MYLRDKRSPRPKSETVSRVMSANRAKDTRPEIVLRRMLWQAGARGYRLHHKRLPGRPDIAFVSKRVAIFVNGCYWHHCPKCNHLRLTINYLLFPSIRFWTMRRASLGF